MKYKVAHLVYSFNVGGLERIIVNLLKATQKDDGVEHVIISLTPNLDLTPQLPQGTQVFCLNKPEGNDIKSHLRLYKLLIRLKPDVLNTYNFGTFEYQVTAKLAGIAKRVHSEHGRDGEYDVSTRRRRSLVRKFVLPFVSNFIVVSPDLEQWAKTELGLRSPKLQFIFNGIDIDAFKCDKGPQATGKQSCSIITVGRLAKVKNHRLLVEAFNILRTSQGYENINLTIVGDGPLRLALQEQVEALGLSDSIHFLGSRDDIPQLLAQADLFVLSSNYEAMPVTVLEAMVAGLPVVSTRVGGVENIIQDKKTGILVEPGDPQALANAIAEALSNKAMTNKVIASARNFALDNFSAQAMKEHYLAIYTANSAVA